MRIQVSEEQYRNLVKKVFGVDVLKEQDAASDAAPKAGTSSDGEKKTNATKWESGVTRGPANQIGVTKWSDIVGATIKRGKANPLTEENIFEQPQATNPPINFDVCSNLPDASKLPLLMQFGSYEPNTFQFKVFDLENLELIGQQAEKDVLDSKKTFAPPANYIENEQKFDFLKNPIDQDNQERLIRDYKEKKLNGVQVFKTFWGEDISLDTNLYKVDLWLPDQNRSEGFNIKNNVVTVYGRNDKTGEIFERKYDNAPKEYYLKRVFPDYTIKNITYDNKRYRCWIKENPVKVLKVTNINRSGGVITGYSWTPILGYGYPDSGEDKVKNGKLSFFTFNKTEDGQNSYKISETYSKLSTWLYDADQEGSKFKNRISFNNKNVPEGFNPQTYDRYLDQIKPFQWSIINAMRQIENMTGKEIVNQFQKNSYEENEQLIIKLSDSTEFGIQQIDNRYNEYTNFYTRIRSGFNEIEKIYKNYRSPIGEGGVFEFSYGITPSQRESYYKTVTTEKVYNDATIRRLESILNNIEQKENTPYEQWLKIKEHQVEYGKWSVCLRSKLNELKKQKTNSSRALQNIYGYDYWKPSFMGKAFDETWDEYGFWIQLLGNVALVLASGGIAIGIRAIFNAPKFLSYIAPYIADATFNALVTAYELNRGNDKEALISLICVLIPGGKYFSNIGKVSREAAESLAVKVSKLSPGQLANKEFVERFMIDLTDEEKEILLNIYSLPRQDFVKVSRLLEKDAKYFNQMMKGASSGITGKLIMKELIYEGGIPFTASMVNGVVGLVKDEVKFAMTGKEWLELKEELERMVENELNEERSKNQSENVSPEEATAVKVFTAVIEAKNSGDLKNSGNYKELITTINKLIDNQDNIDPEVAAQKLNDLINELGGLETLIDIKNQGKQFNNQINSMDPNTSYEPNVSVSSPPKPTKPPV